MKAVVKTDRLAGHVVLQEVPTPVPQKGEARISVKVASICGSDLHAYHYDPSYSFITIPVILGHEFSGVIDAVDHSVTTVKPGDRVVIEAIHYCGQCSSCRCGNTQICENVQVIGLHKNGGFAEFVCVPERFIHKIPDAMSLETASVIEPLSIAVHAVRNRMKAVSGEVVGVMGPGPIGILTAQLIQSVGCTPIVFGMDSDEKFRLPLLREMGMKTVNLSEVAADSILQTLGLDLFDQIVDCSGSPNAIDLGISLLKKGGKLTLVGLFKSHFTMDFSRIVRNEITLMGSYSSTSENYKQAIDLLLHGKVQVNNMLTHYTLTEFDQAFQDAIAQKVIKPILHM